MKKKLVIALAAVLVILALISAIGFLNLPGYTAAQKDGDFTILSFADVQEYRIGEDPKEDAFMRKALAAVKPDLVVFLGDQLNGGIFDSAEEIKEKYRQILAPVIDAKTPFTFVQGNHEDVVHWPESEYSELPNDEYYAFLTAKRYALADMLIELGGDYYQQPDGENLDYGNNKFINVKKNGTDEVFAQVYLFDPGKGWSSASQAQVDWFKTTALPGASKLVFQHLPVTEANAAYPLLKLSKKTVSITAGTIIALFPDYTKFNGVAMGAHGDQLDSIYSRETPSALQFEAFKADGHVLAVANGHDHADDCVVTIDGIDLHSTPIAGWDSPQIVAPVRGARVFTLNTDTPDAYTYQTYTYKDAFGYFGHFRVWYEFFAELVLSYQQGLSTIFALFR